MLDYYKRLFRKFWHDFVKSTREQVIGALLAGAILFFQIRNGVIKHQEVRGNAWSLAWPYIALLVGIFAVHLVRAPWKLDQDRESMNREYKKGQEKIAQLEILLSKQPRPEVIISFDSSQRPKLSRTLQGVVLTNVGGLSAHNLKIVPDKSKKVWIEQIGQVGTILAGKDCPVLIQAMSFEDGIEQRVIGDDEPLRLLLASMIFDGLTPEIFFKLKYESFDGNVYETPFRFGVDDHHQPSFTLLPHAKN